jgi:hypothetical protein
MRSEASFGCEAHFTLLTFLVFTPGKLALLINPVEWPLLDEATISWQVQPQK